MNAILTNVITNALHSTFLFIYFLFSFLHWVKKDKNFNGYIVLFFFATFIGKVLGVWVHYEYDKEYVHVLWIVLYLVTVIINYSIVQSVKMATTTRIIVMMLSLAAALMASVFSNFIYITRSSSFSVIV